MPQASDKRTPAPVLRLVTLTSGNCGLSVEREADIRVEEGARNVSSIRYATWADVHHVRRMGGRVPDEFRIQPLPAEKRQAWIIDYVRSRQEAINWTTPYAVDVLDKYFVERYVTATGAAAKVMMFGADRCAMLGADLSALHRHCKLLRRRTGIGDGLPSQGFPKWVWSYYLPKEKK